VSFYNETSGEAIYPTPTIGMVGLIDDLESHTTQWFTDEGDLIVLLGESKEELGGTEYLKVIHGLDKGMAPSLDLELEKNTQQACLQAINSGIINSAHDLSEGGLAVALFEACLKPGANKGALVKLPDSSVRTDAVLFGETQSRFIVSIAPESLEKLNEIASKAGVKTEVIGSVTGESLEIQGLVDLPISVIKEIWEATLTNYVR
jgi:phosphoribosylformylglycinamidine synthase